jgi:hypothetical protein
VSAVGDFVTDDVEFTLTQNFMLLVAVCVGRYSHTVHRSDLAGHQQLVPSKSIEDAIKTYEALPEVEYAEPNYTFHAF